MRRLITVAAIYLLLVLGAAAQVAPPRVNPKPRPTSVAEPQVSVRDVSFESPSLGRTMRYRIVLPANYESTTRRYPVLYLLHGLTGSYSDWESHTHLAQYAQPLQLIIVMPDAGDSWYSNSASVPADKFETYVTEDLIREVERKYRVISTRHGRAVAGLSMGGYGALKIGLKYPGLFMVAGSFSGALNLPTTIETASLGAKHKERMLAIFGAPDSATRVENDVFALLAKAQPDGLPYFYVDCGTSDHLLKTNREFADLLNQRKIAYEYHEVPGNHTWHYWDQQVQVLLAVLAKHMEVH